MRRTTRASDDHSSGRGSAARRRRHGPEGESGRRTVCSGQRGVRVIFPNTSSGCPIAPCIPDTPCRSGIRGHRAGVRRAGAAVEEAGGLTLRVLGDLDAIRDGVVIELGGRRQRAVLAALIDRPRRRGVRRASRRMRVGRRGGRARGRRAAVLRQPFAGTAAARLRCPQPYRCHRPGRPRLRPRAWDRWPSTPGGSSTSSGPSPISPHRNGSASSARRWTSGGARPSRNTRTSRGRRPRSPG